MKLLTTYLIFVGLLLIPLESFGNPYLAVIAKKRATGGASYDFLETFDPSGADNTWTDVALTPDYDYATAPAPLEGTYSMLLDSGEAGSVPVPGGFTTEFYAYFQFEAASPTGPAQFFRLISSGAANVVSVRVFSATALDCYHGAVYKGPDITFAAGNTYGVWVHWVSDADDATDDDDGVLQVWVSAADSQTTKPGSPQVDISNGADGSSIAGGKIQFNEPSATTGTMIIDRVILSLTDIPTAP